MIAFILVTVLNSEHPGPSMVRIKTSSIAAMRTPEDGKGCLLTHKDIEEEVRVAEDCLTVFRATQAKDAKKSKKPLKGWFFQ